MIMVDVYLQWTKTKAKGTKYDIAYWSQHETYDDATDFDMSIFKLAADLISNDLTM